MWIPCTKFNFFHTLKEFLLFAGFQSVVGTMWSICDSDAPQIAESFYQNLIQDGSIQFSDTAAALHRAVKDWCLLTAMGILYTHRSMTVLL